jgi:amino acid adenylation domain-containing protein
MTFHPVIHRLMSLPGNWSGREAFRTTATSLSFGQLRESVLRSSAWLAGKFAIGPGDRIAFCLPKSIEAIQVMFGILAVGAAYVPLPILGPVLRQKQILDSVKPKLLIAAPEVAASLEREFGAANLPPVFIVHSLADGGGLDTHIRDWAPASTTAGAAADDLCAIYYTSGSTGEPKGVMYAHRGLSAAVEAVVRLCGMREDDRLISVSGLHYSSTAGVLYPLLQGCSCYLLDDREIMFAERIGAAMERDRTTIWLASATVWRLLVEAGQLEKCDLKSLRLVKLVGEPISIPLLRRSMEALPGVRFYNHYAASEAFYIAEHEIPQPLDMALKALPVGGPSDIYDLSLRDEAGVPVAVGEVGEICVIGPSVLQGYWNDTALTEAKRLPGIPESFRTGDLASFSSDGLLRLAGRKDHVVKLRGNRFDLGEIEAVLRSHPAVRDAVAFLSAATDSEEVVTAVVLAAENSSLIQELRQLCRDRLPGFARPAAIRVASQFPMSSTGKVDRQAVRSAALVGPRR